jgi:hypothetical protein
MEGDPMQFMYRADMGEEEENWHYSDVGNNYEEWFERVAVQSTDYLDRIKWAGKDEDGIYDWERGKSPLPWRPAIFIPRWASRITLEMVNVRVERLQEITEEDALSEGVNKHLAAELGISVSPSEEEFNFTQARSTFCHLWNSINAKSGFGWYVNPWVWVIEFKRVTQ